MFNSRSLRYAVLVVTVAMLAAGYERAPENEGDGPTMKFVRIPAGSFYMGSPSLEKDRNDNEGPVHQVQITEPFYMGRYEVTQAQWKAVMGTTVSQQRDKFVIPWRLKGEGPEYPMYYVSWEEAVEFCKKLGKRFRLPTEAEWEYACRAGSQTRFYYGDDPNYSELDKYAWYYGNNDNKTHPAGQKKPNAWGLYDMYGNVSELCSDQYSLLGGYKVAESVHEAELASKFMKYMGHVIRGGNWRMKSNQCRSATRSPGFKSDLLGFRVVFTSSTNDDKEVMEITLPKETEEAITTLEQKPKVQSNDGLIIAGVVRDQAGMPIDDVEMHIWPSRVWGLRMYAKGHFEAYKPSRSSDSEEHYLLGRRPTPTTPSRSSDSEEHYLLVRHVERNLAAAVKIVEDTNALDVKLEPGVIVNGKVVDANGKALEGAIVGTALQGSDWRAIIPPLGMKTDAEGKFTFRALPIGYKYSFYARLIHYRPTEFEFNTGDARDNRLDLGSIVLARGQFSVSGIVVDANGKPVPNVGLYCTGKGQAGINSETDEHGRFKADGIFEGQVKVIANIKGDNGRWLSGSISTEAGATNVKIVLGTGGMPPPKGRACFPADTDVWWNGAVVQISQVAEGQTVGRHGCAVPTAAFGQIERIEEHMGAFECRDIVLENGNRISVVDAHCFMLDSGRWIAAQDLRSGQRLKTLNGVVTIKSVTTRATPFVGKVYNLKIRSSDRYMVGKDGVIVRDY